MSVVSPVDRATTALTYDMAVIPTYDMAVIRNTERLKYGKSYLSFRFLL